MTSDQFNLEDPKVKRLVDHAERLAGMRNAEHSRQLARGQAILAQVTYLVEELQEVLAATDEEIAEWAEDEFTFD